jgi:hypothetical protein
MAAWSADCSQRPSAWSRRPRPRSHRTVHRAVQVATAGSRVPGSTCQPDSLAMPTVPSGNGQVDASDGDHRLGATGQRRVGDAHIPQGGALAVVACGRFQPGWLFRGFGGHQPRKVVDHGLQQSPPDQGEREHHNDDGETWRPRAKPAVAARCRAVFSIAPRRWWWGRQGRGTIAPTRRSPPT